MTPELEAKIQRPECGQYSQPKKVMARVVLSILATESLQPTCGVRI